MDDPFRRVIVSEDDVARQQIEEDLLLYGSRPEPPDPVEVDESTQLANLPPMRTASEFEAAVDRPAKRRKKGESKEFNHQALTVMDWNSGASPLDARLNQSAVPSTTAALSQHDSTEPQRDLLAQESEEIQVFRNVHMAVAPSPERKHPALEPIVSLDFGAQIYYRNMVDRYPAIPVYLARRLAQANCDRADRLRNEKESMQKESMRKENERRERVEKESLEDDDDDWEALLFLSDPIGSDELETTKSLSENFASPLTEPSLLLPRQSTLEEYFAGELSSVRLTSTQRDVVMPPSPPRRSSPSEHFETDYIHPTRPPTPKSGAIPPTLSPVSDFWTGDSPRPRSASADSRSSSRNSSLHGRPVFDPQEQNPTFTVHDTAPTACNTPSLPGLPPPPVELGQVKTLNCDICGQNIQVTRRRQWQ